MNIAMIEDKIVPAEELEPVFLDRGIYFGDGVYEVVRSYNGKIFALEEHLQRLANSLAAIEITGVDIGLIRSRVQRAFDTAMPLVLASVSSDNPVTVRKKLGFRSASQL